MVKFKNESDKRMGFYDGSRHWTFNPNEEKEVPEEHAYRAKAHGLVEVGAKPAAKPKTVKKKRKRR